MIDKDQKTIINIVLKYLPKAKIYLFGSRSRKDHWPESDIDIAVDNNKKIESYTLSLIKEEIEESTIPYTVDIVDIHTISEDLKNKILKDGILWQ